MIRDDLIKWLAKYDALDSKPMITDTIDEIIKIFIDNNYKQIRKGDIYWTREQLSELCKLCHKGGDARCRQAGSPQ